MEEEDLSAAISAKRKREGLNLRDAATLSGVAFSTLGRIEAGASPSLRVDRLLRAWLTGETPTLPTPPMTLRDYFAGQALVGIGTWRPSRKGEPPADARQGQQWQAEWAYQMADAMLTERGRELAKARAGEGSV